MELCPRSKRLWWWMLGLQVRIRDGPMESRAKQWLETTGHQRVSGWEQLLLSSSICRSSTTSIEIHHFSEIAQAPADSILSLEPFPGSVGPCSPAPLFASSLLSPLPSPLPWILPMLNCPQLLKHILHCSSLSLLTRMFFALSSLLNHPSILGGLTQTSTPSSLTPQS